MDKLALVRFGELSTKGDNRTLFIDCLYRNIKRSLSEYETEIVKSREHIYIYYHSRDEKSLLNDLGRVAGIQRISIGMKLDRDLDNLKARCLEVLKAQNPASWKANVKRVDKSFPISSMDLTQEIGGYCLENGAPKVDVHNPELNLRVEIRKEAIYLTYADLKGAGGYPLGILGKGLLLLSGGIDSPVAAYSLLKRGIYLECLHFASPPYTSDAVIDKLKALAKKLTPYQDKIVIHVVPFTKIQEAIYNNIDEPYCITIMRRMMMRIAERAAKKFHCLTIATGESIGQVASQTLESLVCINEVTNFPILRPLATLDKLDIIDIAKKIETYDISIEPFEDCCTIFAPRSPVTRPKIEIAKSYESRFDYEGMIEDAVQNIQKIVVSKIEEDKLF